MKKLSLALVTLLTLSAPANAQSFDCSRLNPNTRFFSETIRFAQQLCYQQNSQPQTTRYTPTVYVAGDNVNLRTGASTNSNIIAVLPKYTLAQSIEIVNQTGTEFAWVKILSGTHAGTYGYIAKQYLDMD